MSTPIPPITEAVTITPFSSINCNTEGKQFQASKNGWWKEREWFCTFYHWVCYVVPQIPGDGTRQHCNKHYVQLARALEQPTGNCQSWIKSLDCQGPSQETRVSLSLYKDFVVYSQAYEAGLDDPLLNLHAMHSSGEGQPPSLLSNQHLLPTCTGHPSIHGCCKGILLE